MAAQDTSGLKEKIISIIRRKGPSLPVHIAKETGLSILFTSAFLSELTSEKKIKISHMKVGSSPIYFIPGQEYLLRNFSQHLKSREKDAFILLQEKKFLEDKKQEPAIRVALREIRDFAIPFQKNDEIIWRYFTSPESEYFSEDKEKSLEIFDKPKEPKQSQEEKSKTETSKEEKIMKKKKISEKTKTKKTSKKHDEKFFNKVKNFLAEEGIEILDIQSFNKTDFSLKVRQNGRDKILIAYNKKRVNEEDIIKADKKASSENLSYIILSKGEPLKKLSSLIEAIKNLSDIKKVE